MENPIKMDDLGVPLFLETPKYKLMVYRSKMGCQTFIFPLPETNIAPENRPSQEKSGLPNIHFQVRTVSFRECRGRLIKKRTDHKSISKKNLRHTPLQQTLKLIVC